MWLPRQRPTGIGPRRRCPAMPTDENEVEDLVRRAVRSTYAPGQLERVAYVDVHYLKFDEGSHVLRARAPSHGLLAYDRWIVVSLDDRTVHLRGDGQAGPTEYYVRARIEPP